MVPGTTESLPISLLTHSQCTRPEARHLPWSQQVVPLPFRQNHRPLPSHLIQHHSTASFRPGSSLTSKSASTLLELHTDVCGQEKLSLALSRDVSLSLSLSLSLKLSRAHSLYHSTSTILVRVATLTKPHSAATKNSSHSPHFTMSHTNRCPTLPVLRTHPQCPTYTVYHSAATQAESLVKNCRLT